MTNPNAKIFTPSQTSASLLAKFAEAQANSNSNNSEVDQKKYLIIYDLYIKARSYAILNKISFFLSIISSLGVLIWPSLGVVLNTVGEAEWFKSAIVQTTITGIAALTYSLYSQYKSRQLQTENLMRRVIFSSENIETLAKLIAEELARIDQGFGFSIATKSENNANDKNSNQPH